VFFQLYRFQQTGTKNSESFGFIFNLRLLILTGYDQSAGKMSNSYGRVGGVNTLSSGAGRTVYIYFEVFISDV